MSYCKRNWYKIFVFTVISTQLIVFLICGESSYIAIHDNLDLFTPHFKLMKDYNLFFAQDTTLPMLGGVSRDLFASELSLYNLLYAIFPTFLAYMIGYFLKILIGFYSMRLLVNEFLPQESRNYEPFVWLISLSYGLIPAFPAYGIAFTSIPLVVYLVYKIITAPKLIYLICLFAYPFLSYFSYFGFFILAYMCLTLVLLFLYKRKINKGLLIGIPTLFLGYVVFEYRLFREMLFSNTVSIRSTITFPDVSLFTSLKMAAESLVEPVFHAQDSHKYFVLFLIIIFFFYINGKRGKNALDHNYQLLYNILLGILLFNSLVYGLYYYKPTRDLFEFLLPPLEGFQFNRTYFFNPFIWDLLTIIMLKYLYDSGKQLQKYAANTIAFLCVMIVLLVPQVYNDFYYTCYNTAYKLLKHQNPYDLSYEEFYSTSLFHTIKEEIQYNGEYSIAYGLYPAVLQYNTISTLDGYLGLYPQSYKDDFRALVAPGLALSESARIYYDDWGARAYITSTTGLSALQLARAYTEADQILPIDMTTFKKLGGRYIFSTIKLTNAEELSIQLLGEFIDASSPYTVYVYMADTSDSN